MTIEYPATGDPVALVAQLRALATDIERMQMFRPREQLDDAPTLENWDYSSRFVTSLTGNVTQHPILTGKRTIITSEVYAIDKRAGWVRTLSRFYNLGRRANESEGN